MDFSNLHSFNIGKWQVSPGENLITSEDEEKSITSTSMRLLVCFAKYNGEVVSREVLISEVWQDRIVSDETISRTVAYLRKDLGDSAKESRYIKTISKHGYKLVVLPQAKLQQKKELNKKLVRFLFVGAFLTIFLISLLFQRAQQQRSFDQLVRTPLDTYGYSYVRQPRFSPSGRFIISNVGSELVVYDLQEDTSQILFDDNNLNETLATFSSSEEQIAFFSERVVDNEGNRVCDIVLYTFKTQHSRRLTSCDGIVRLSFDWSLDDRLLYMTKFESDESKGVIISVDTLTGEQRVIIEPESSTTFFYPRISPSGEKLAFVRFQVETGKTSIVVMELQDNDEAPIEFDIDFVTQVVWESDKLLFYSVARGGKEGIWRLNIDSNEKILLYNEKIQDFDFDSINNRFVTAVTTTLRQISRARKSDEQWYITPEISLNSNSYFPSVNYSGTQLAYISDQQGYNNIYIKDLVSGVSKPLTRNKSGRRDIPLWSQDNKKLLFLDMGEEQSDVVVVNIQNGQELFRLGSVRLAVWSFSPEKIIVSFKSKQGLFEVDIKNGHTRQLYDKHLYISVPISQNQFAVQLKALGPVYILNLAGEAPALTKVVDAERLFSWAIYKDQITLFSPQSDDKKLYSYPFFPEEKNTLSNNVEVGVVTHHSINPSNGDVYFNDAKQFGSQVFLLEPLSNN